MKYVDGFVLVVKKNKLNEYRDLAKKAAKIWKKYGALQYFECVGDDLFPDMDGFKILNFPKMIKSKSGETVIFSFIVYKSRAHRDSVNKKVMSHFEKDKTYKDKPMPFDMKRRAYGGFTVLVEE